MHSFILKQPKEKKNTVDMNKNNAEAGAIETTTTKTKTELELLELNKNAIVINDEKEFSKEKCQKNSKFENFRFSDKQKLKTIGLGDKMPAHVRKLEVWDENKNSLGIAERKGIAGGFYYESGRYAAILDGYSAEIKEVDEKMEETIAKNKEEFRKKYKTTFDKIDDNTEVEINGEKRRQKELVYEVAEKYGIDPSLLLASQVTENGSEYSLAEYEMRLNMEARRLQHTLVGYEKMAGNPLDTDGNMSLDVIAAFSARYSFDDANSDHLERLAKKYMDFTGKKFDLSPENLSTLKQKYEILRKKSDRELDPRVKEEYEKFAKDMNVNVDNVPEKEKFYTLAKAAAQKIEELTGLPWRVTVAQAILETGHGKHAPNNNCFGIKGAGAIQKTAEFENGKYVQKDASFRTYNSMFDSFYDYAKLILTSRRYSTIIDQYKSGTINSSKDILAGIIKAGYATSPTYVKNAEGALNTYGESLNDQIAYNAKYETLESKNAGINIKEINPEFYAGFVKAKTEWENDFPEKGNVRITSGYRSIEQQKEIRARFGYTSDDEKSGSGGRAMAAAPGKSRHQFGEALDITGNNWKKEDYVKFNQYLTKYVPGGTENLGEKVGNDYVHFQTKLRGEDLAQAGKNFNINNVA